MFRAGFAPLHTSSFLQKMCILDEKCNVRLTFMRKSPHKTPSFVGDRYINIVSIIGKHHNAKIDAVVFITFSE